MRIAVIDVAAESGGAQSVLRDFLSYVSDLNDEHNEYYVFVSKNIDIDNSHIHYILKPEIKKSWINRLKWERFDAINELEELNINVVFSLQNTAFFSKKIKQIVYFHNVLLLEPKTKYSIWKKEERLYGIYTRLIAPYTLNSLKNAEVVICQTNTVKDEIQRRLPGINAIAVNPNVDVNDEYINTAVSPIKGYIYPTAPLPFKRIEEIFECIRYNNIWFIEQGLEMLVTISGRENAYAQKLFEIGKMMPCIKFIGYQNRERILELYRDHALIINSELESFPLPFIEKDLVGGPIIAADYQYAIEICKELRNAKTYKKNNIDDMFEKIKWAANNTNIENNNGNNLNTWRLILDIICNNKRR